MAYKVLVVDDDPFQCRATQLAIEKMLKYEVITMTSGQEAIKFLLAPEGQSINLVILDLSMPIIDGMEVLRKVTPIRRDLPIIIHTAHGDIKKAVEAVKEGAIDFIEKQDGPERMKVSIENVRKISTLSREVEKLDRFKNNKFYFTDIIGDSLEMKKTVRIAKKAARSNIPVLIKGESGVGKELFARSIHTSSLRNGRPFVAVNCAAIPQNLVESILFGHEKGAFTGAVDKSLGKFREADTGTIFLDEIGELSLEIQAKLLRVLQNSEVEPLGSGKTHDVNIRIISATNRNLKEMVETGKFREDLYYRINVFPFIVPPLRKRKQDIVSLLDYFVEKICLRENRRILDIDDKVKEMLQEYRWPGNVHQLENAVYRAIVMSEGNVITCEDFEHIINTVAPTGEEVHKDKTQTTSGGINLIDAKTGKFKSLADYEKDIIQYALDFYNWHISKVSKHLGIGRSTLYRKMREYGIDFKEGMEEDPSIAQNSDESDSSSLNDAIN